MSLNWLQLEKQAATVNKAQDETNRQKEVDELASEENSSKDQVLASVAPHLQELCL